MKNLNKKSVSILKSIMLSFLMIASVTSCKTMQTANNKQKGAVIGAAGGAILGGIIGNNAGKGGKGGLGAAIGGIIGGAAGVLIGNKMDKQAQQIEDEIPGATVERINDEIVITFDENSGVYFDTNQSSINSSSREILDKLSVILREYRNTDVKVTGHTDSVGSEQSNLVLSEKRAKSITNYFINSQGFNSSRFTTSWYGESVPAYDNSTARGRAKNRRVNVTIIPNKTMIENAKSSTFKD